MKLSITEKLIQTSSNLQSMDWLRDSCTNSEFTQSTSMAFLNLLMTNQYMPVDFLKTLTGPHLLDQLKLPLQ